MPYDPESRGNRTYLALALKAMLADSGFTRVKSEVIEEEAKHSKSKKEDPNKKWRQHPYWKSLYANTNTRAGPQVDVIRAREDVYEYITPEPRIRIRVYTTIVGKEVRRSGEDAIRVCLVYKNGEHTKGLSKQRRVNRTGTINDIVNRTRGRMRDAFKDGAKLEKCHCGAPKFKSKKNNMVCAELCWTKKGK